MSERFGIPDHAPQHAPDHALQNPTYADPVSIGGGGWEPAASSGQPVYGGGGGGTYSPGPYVRPKRSVLIAILLATVLGPFGLFYVNILSGIAALMILPTVGRELVVGVALAYGGDINTVSRTALPILWSITILWSIIGVKIRNARIDRKNSNVA